VYLQKAVEQITGKPANDLMRDTVFGPLGMVHSSYIWNLEYDQLSATGHDMLGRVVSKNKPAEMRAAATLHTTALEYARFVAAILKGEGLSRESSRQALTPQVKVDEQCTNCLENKPARLSPSLSWGLGWGLEKGTAGADYFWHWGDNGTFRCFVMASRRNRAGILIFTNSSNGLSIVEEVLRLSLGGTHPAVAWLKYDQYDSPAGRLRTRVSQDGAERAIQFYREGQQRSGWPLPAGEQVNGLGHALLQGRKLEDAIRLFEWNTELFPESAKVFDSLAEAYAARGQTELAIRNYRKSLELNPSNQNARDKLKELEKSPVR
jgi:CubicO group peptidase (beta-lactamase class C family)